VVRIMNSKFFDEIASLMLGTAEHMIAKRPAEYGDPISCLRGGIMWAMLSVEMSNGTSKEDLLKFMGNMYDILNDNARDQKSKN
jgi:hypothetical protein